MSITTRGAKCLRTLCSYHEVSLCLVSQVTSRSSTFASSIEYLAKSLAFHHITHCLSQAYGCSDRYNIYTTTTHPVHHMLSRLPPPATTSNHNGSMTTDKGGRMLKQPPMPSVVLQCTNGTIPSSDQHNQLQHHCDHQP